jgi:phage tail sheath gpL-like
MSRISNPVVTLNIIPRDYQLGLEDRRALLIGQKTSAGLAAAGLYRNLPRTAAEINELFGARSHLAQIARAFREVNPVTNVDVISLADNAGGTAATAVCVFTGTATASRTIYFAAASGQNNRYEVDVAIGDTAAVVAGKFLTAIGLDTSAPFTAGLATATITLTAANKGTIPNTWLISLLDAFDKPAIVPGLTYTLTGWTGGATNPSLTTLFDEVLNIRYQDIVYPEAYTSSYLYNYINPRKNVDNDIMDGTAYKYITDTFSNVKAAALALNSSEIVLLNNKANALSYWIGPCVPEIPDVIAARFAAAVSRRFEDAISISDLVVTNEPNDQFGGQDKVALPLFNTPLLNTRVPLNGSGWSEAEQRELQDNGITVLGGNRQNNAVIMGVVVTTYQNDAAGNEDDTWRYLEWRQTHGVIREVFVRNLRKQFSQYRLSTGIAVAGYSIATEAIIRAYMYLLYDQLAEQAITIKGRDARIYFENSLVVKIKADLRRVEIAADTPMMSQLGAIIGSVKFNFTPGGTTA